MNQTRCAWSFLVVASMCHLQAQTPEAKPAAAMPDPRAAAAALPLQPAAERSVKLTVLDPDGKPCPGAVVFLPSPCRVPTEQMRAASEAFAQDPIALLAATALVGGMRLRLDAQGSTRLDADYEGNIIAFQGNSAATRLRSQQASREPITLKLANVDYVPVAVTQSDGSPAPGVAITFDLTSTSAGRVLVRTGDDGTARIPVLKTSVAANAQFAVRALVATEQLWQQKLDRAPTTPIRWQLPACGSVRVTLKGVPSGTRAQVQLARNPSGSRSFALNFMGNNPARGLPQSFDGTTAVFAYVEAGSTVTVGVTLDGMPNAVNFVVPEVKTGAQTEVTADLDAGSPRVVAQILNADGKPIANTELSGTFEGGENRSSLSLRTDAAGWIQFAVDTSSAMPSSVLLQQRASPMGAVEVVAATKVPLADLKPGRNEVAAPRMLPLPLAFEGRFLQEDRQGLAGVRIYASVGLSAPYYSTLSGPDGKFSLRMPEPHPPQLTLRLNTGAGVFFADNPFDPTKIALEPGTSSGDIPVVKAGRIPVGLVPPLTDFRGDIEVACIDPDNKDLTYATRISAETTSLMVPPGRWNVKLRLYQQDVYAIDGLTVEAGIECHEPRLMRLRWDEFARFARIRITDPAGQPAENCSVMVTYNSGRSGSGSIAQGGTMSLLLPKEGTTVQIQPRDPAYQTAELGEVDGDRSVQLQPSLRVTLRWKEPLKLPEGLDLLIVSDLRSGIRNETIFGADHSTTMFVAKPGKVALRFSLRKGNTTHYLNPRVDVEIDEKGSPIVLEMTEALRQEIDRRAGQLGGG